MSRIPLHRLFAFTCQLRRQLISLCILSAIAGIQGIAFGEGTKQLEPNGAPGNSVCKLVLLQNQLEYRIPFALLDCSEEFRLNVRVNDFNAEKIYFGFGNIIDYFNDSIYNDVSFQVKDPAGNVVVGYSLKPLTFVQGDAGFIQTRDQVDQGPDISNTNPGGYKPLIINPAMNGDYIIEFKIPDYNKNQIRVFKYIDVTVANGNNPVPGRLWSKAWQLGSGSVTADESASYSLFYIYTNDSIVTRFNCNGLAGGVWDIYSNEWGCATNGSWNDRRRSITGNATVQPEYKIFLSDPDPLVFPSGHIGKMNDFKVLPNECDTVITFEADVSKAGNIEILVDVPPLNPNSIGPEDVQLGYIVSAGKNILLPAWDGKDGHGFPVANGAQVTTRIRFLNGLSNVPLYDVEDNPNGFKVDIQRPVPVSGNTKLKLFWDDTRLPSHNSPTSNSTVGCFYSGLDPESGCHAWKWKENQSLGDTNTINTWWYLTTDEVLDIPITVKLRPLSGYITGPTNICIGQPVSLQTASIPYAQKYIWSIAGPGISTDFEITAPDTTFNRQFSPLMPQGHYTASVFGHNLQCGDGNSVSHPIIIHNLPEAAFIHDNPCQGAGIIFTDHSNPADTTLTQYTWNVRSVSGNEQTFYGNPAVIKFDEAASYYVSLAAMDAFGCTDTASSVIAIKPKPGSSFEYIENSGNTRGKLHFENRTTGAINYSWNFGNNITSTLTNPDITYNLEGEYTIMLVATNPEGCRDTATKQYYYLPGFWLPNAFTPNHDGQNDVFRPVTQRTSLEPYQLLIFNRWGQLIFRSTNPDEGWDGTFEGEQCQSGIYSYMVQYRMDKNESSGTVTRRGVVSLIR